ncbi:hypothetical protein KAJ89_01660 [Candidatus Parcubacteria bacterium]|nr:hypothetical protein [Candidatus Parcubacteria bacterium]
MFKPKLTLTKLIITIVLALGMSISFQSLLAAWTAPTVAPPDDNLAQPIDTSASSQGKVGDLQIGGNLLVDLNTLAVDSVNNRVGVGTDAPNYELDVNGDINFIGDLHQNGSLVAGVPSGFVGFFNSASCPPGWSELIGARGRAVVGMPGGGTLAGTVGTGLSDQGTRVITEVPEHTHTGTTDFSGDHRHADPKPSHMRAADLDPAGAIWVAQEPGWTGWAGNHNHELEIASTGPASVDVTMPYIQLLVCEKD